MSTLLIFGRFNSASWTAGIDFALTLIALEKPPTLLFIKEDSPGATNQQITPELAGKLTLAKELSPTLKCYTLASTDATAKPLAPEGKLASTTLTSEEARDIMVKCPHNFYF